jgi:DNA-binding FadR family transcriptional regulator
LIFGNRVIISEGKMADSIVSNEIKSTKTSMSFKAYAEIKRDILRGRFKEGKLPSERKLTSLYGISHSMVREGLRMLESEGMIRVAPGERSVITVPDAVIVERSLREISRFRNVSAEDIMDFFCSREQDMIVYAAENRTGEDIAELEKALSDMEEINEFGVEYFARMMRFHYLAVKAAHNPLATLIWSGLLQSVTVYSDEDTGVSTEELTGYRRELLEAIKAGDADAVYTASRRCLDSSYALKNIKAEYAGSGSGDGVGTGAESAPDEVFYSLRERILSGEIKAGDKLEPERKLAEQYGRSRATIREALKMLEARGYLTTTQGSGAVVNDEGAINNLEQTINNLLYFDKLTKKDFYEVRRSCGTYSVENAAKRRTDEDIEKIDRVIRETEALDGDVKEVFDKWAEFRNAIVEASHNEIADIINKISLLFVKLRAENIHGKLSEEELDKIVEQFKAVRDGIAAHDPEAAMRGSSGTESIFYEGEYYDRIDVKSAYRELDYR